MKKIMRMRENKGFTLAELLIVVAIIAVLVAIAIPIFSSQLEKSREATDVANIRSAYATLAADFIQTPGAKTMNVPVNARLSGWQTTPAPTLQTMKDGTTATVAIPSKSSGNYTVTISAGGTVAVN